MAELHEKSHDTIVLAWDKKGDVVYCRSFSYPKDEKDMRDTIDFVSKTYWPFHVGSVASILHMSQFKSEEIGQP